MVSNNLCIGCGLCAGICPRNNLRVEFNEFGELIAARQGTECLPSCGLCMSVCPFADGNADETVLAHKLFSQDAGIKYVPEAGYYCSAFVGYSAVDGHREKGASGGLATWFLEALLREGQVDFVACVERATDSERLYRFNVFSSPEDIRRCSGSCYYPVEISDVVRHILNHDARYAVIGLPCVCKALRLAAHVSPKIGKRLRYVLGLVCGQTKSRFFSEYVCALGGGDPNSLNRLAFRVKNPGRSASDFGMEYSCGRREDYRTGIVHWSEGIAPVWTNRYFTPNACDFCDDAFAEAADISFMDAWLPEFACDWQGRSIVLVRKRDMCSLLRDFSDRGDLALEQIGIDRVIESQSGVLFSKRAEIAVRIKSAEEFGRVVPAKRRSLFTSKLSLAETRTVEIKTAISQRSRTDWVLTGKSPLVLAQRLRNETLRLDWWAGCRRFRHRLSRFSRRFKRVFSKK